jgi:hypothetical protein
MSYSPRTIDAAEATLKAGGWSVGDAAYRRDHGIVWLVTCIRGDERITIEADNQLAAWQRAVELSRVGLYVHPSQDFFT